VTPFEFGNWQGDFNSFTPTKYLGTELENGMVVNKSACVQGFDKARYDMLVSTEFWSELTLPPFSFMIGSSASAVNAWYIEDISNGTLGTFAKRQIEKRQDNAVPLSELDTILDIFNSTFGEPKTLAGYSSWPNPFMGLNTTTPELQGEKYLKIVDGSLAGQTIPIWSLIQPARALDFIFAWDDSQDARPQSWNNGTNLYNTYKAAKAANLPL